jgi:outer membrane protein
MTTMISRPIWIGLAALALAGTPGGAQSLATEQATPVLTLQAVVDATLVGNSQIRNDWLQAEGFRGQLVAKAAPFDLQFHTAVQRGHDNTLVQPAQFAIEQATTYEVSLTRQLRSGVTLSPSVQVTQSQLSLLGAPATGAASVGLGAVVPLLFDRGGAVSARAERVAEYYLECLQGGWQVSVMVNVNGAVGSYWSYVAADARLHAHREAELRAQLLLDETTQLVQKEERAPADLTQLRANLAVKRSARILAEQAVVEARVQLGTTMGLDAATVMALGAPATGFPEPAPDAAPSASSIPRLTETAQSRRPDLAAARARIRALDLEVREFRAAMLPRLDLVMNVGYQGLTAGPGLNHLVSPLYRNVPGLNATLRFRYDVSVANSAARGQLTQEAALVDQQYVALRDVERQVVTDVQTAAFGIDRSALALRESEDAGELFRQSVENEKRKLQLGMSTLFDVLNAEDALTNALLTIISNRRTYAVSLASLRAATGTLVEIAGNAPRVDAARLLVAP